MTNIDETISTNSDRWLELLLKATRTSNKTEAIKYWEYFIEIIDPDRKYTQQSLTNGNYISLVSKKTDVIIQTLAQQLDADKLSALHYAAHYNNLFICCKFAHAHCDFNTIGKNGDTILHIAAQSKIINQENSRISMANDSEEQQSLLIFLLSKKNDKQKPIVNIDKGDNQGRTALHHAVMSNRIKNVKVLLDYEACITIKDIRQATALHYACRFNRTNNIIQYLLLKANSYQFESNKMKSLKNNILNKSSCPMDSKLDYINAKTIDGHDAFSLARTYHNENILDELFKHIPYDDFRWQEKDKIIYDQIHQAILNEDFSLLDKYPVWLCINEKTGETSLHVACKLGYPVVVLHLLDRQYYNIKNEPNILFLRDKQNGFTPILSAAFAGQVKCFEHMLNFILNSIDTKNSLNKFINQLFIDRYERTLLHICVLSKQIHILEILMVYVESNPLLFVHIIYPMIFSLDFNDETPLHIAVRLNLDSQCQLLLLYADKLDEIQQPFIYLDRIDHELIRSIDIDQEDIQYIPSYMLSMLSKSHVFIIGHKNRNGQSPFHIAILHGYIHIMNLFLKHVNTYGMNYLLTHTDINFRTALHIASMYGHSDIIRKLFSLHVNVCVRDDQESTPLHYVAGCAGIKYYYDIDVSICILDMFLRYIKNSTTNSFDILTAVNGFGHNCLETATISGNRSFVEYFLNLNNIQLFKSLLRNAQLLDIHYKHVDTPLRKLVTYMPDLAYRILDIFITHIGDQDEAHHKIIYDFEFLEDHCYINQWQHNRTTQIILNDSKRKCLCPIFCHHKQLEFKNEYYVDKSHQLLVAYTKNPYILVHNSVLSIMCKCAKQVNLKNKNQETSTVLHTYKLMHHPLCSQLTQIKWKQFGLPLFSIFFLIYCLYLVLFTIVMLKTRQSEYFYKLVNASFSNGYYSNATALSCKAVSKRLVHLNIKEAMKQPVDHILKTLLIILLWTHIIKDALLIIGVHRLAMVWRIYMEIITIVLSFICLYDCDQWQTRLRFRCPIQWQVGAFGIFLAWTTLLSYLRFVPIFGVYVVMLEVIMLKFLWFAPVLIVLICSYSFAFYMLLQNQPVFSTITFAWLRSAFMVLDTGYEDRFFGPDSEEYVSLYPVLFIIFLCFGVTMTILVNNLLIALAVGEITDLSAIARVRNATRQYELLREWEIFRLQCLWSPAPFHVRYEHVETKWNRKLQTCLKWIYRYNFLKMHD